MANSIRPKPGNNFKHGYSHTPEHRAWMKMRERCNNPNDKSFQNYGGRGISVCERWLDFTNFIADMGDRPSKKHSIDRIDNDGDYTPENCRWATFDTQQQNKRHKAKYGSPGVSVNRHGKYIAYIQTSGKRVHLGSFATLDEAVAARKMAESEQRHN